MSKECHLTPSSPLEFAKYIYIRKERAEGKGTVEGRALHSLETILETILRASMPMNMSNRALDRLLYAPKLTHIFSINIFVNRFRQMSAAS
jgi:hypothetical protein